jgi:hypothetical protein
VQSLHGSIRIRGHAVARAKLFYQPEPSNPGCDCGTRFAFSRSMRTVMLDLLALQILVRRGGVPKLEELDAIEQVRGRIPESILKRFDRRMAQAGRAVALVHHGICDECHMRIPVGAYVNLVNPCEEVACEHCGCFLVLAPEDMPTHMKPRAVTRTVAA